MCLFIHFTNLPILSVHLELFVLEILLRGVDTVFSAGFAGGKFRLKRVK